MSMTLKAFGEVKYTRRGGDYLTSFIGLVNIRILLPATCLPTNGPRQTLH